MFLARVLCSDPRCFEEREIVVADLDDLDRDVCDRGHGYVLVAVATAQAG
jgi:hypothetical protein